MTISGVSSSSSAYPTQAEVLAQLTQSLQDLAKTRQPVDPSCGQQFLAQLQSLGVLPAAQTESSTGAIQSSGTNNAALRSGTINPVQSSDPAAVQAVPVNLTQPTPSLQDLAKTRVDASSGQQFLAQLQTLEVLPAGLIQNNPDAIQSSGAVPDVSEA